jgi:hypothetical protein
MNALVFGFALLLWAQDSPSTDHACMTAENIPSRGTAVEIAEYYDGCPWHALPQGTLVLHLDTLTQMLERDRFAADIACALCESGAGYHFCEHMHTLDEVWATTHRHHTKAFLEFMRRGKETLL